MTGSGPTVLELFAGIGGMSLGLERAGFRVVGQVEIDPFARAVLAKHWPEVPKHDDVCTALDWWLSEARPRVDCIAGGYPCQGESDAGNRLSTEDERWLWPEFARIIHGLCATQDQPPRWVIGENVGGHRTRGLRFVLRDLERLGYSARAGTLSAGEMGAPHRRKRIFVIAELANARGQVGRCETGPALTGPSGQAIRAGAPGSGRRGSDVADTNSTGLDAGGRLEQAWPAAERAGWWSAEPDVGRVADGVPVRVDRLRGLGNAVVPACAEHIGRLTLTGAWRDA